MESQNIKFRNASLKDAKQILEIYKYYVEKTAITFEWSVPSLKEFKLRMKNTMKKFPYIVAFQGEKILGYSYVSAFKERKAYDWAVETTIYLDSSEQHHGVGKKLYFVMEEICKRMNILNLNACIAFPKKDDEFLTKNSAQFHEHLGYKLVGEFHDCGYKFDQWYNMVWMEKMLGEHLKNPQKVLNYNEIKNNLCDILEQIN